MQLRDTNIKPPDDYYGYGKLQEVMCTNQSVGF